MKSLLLFSNHYETIRLYVLKEPLLGNNINAKFRCRRLEYNKADEVYM